jgi:hypothetical protein
MLDALKDIGKSRREFVSLLGAFLPVISGGVYMTYGIFNPTYSYPPVHNNISYFILFLLLALPWHLGCIAGFIAAPYYCSTFTKKTIYVSRFVARSGKSSQLLKLA